jgi:hypothetical protein
MSWVKLDDQLADHPKIAQAGPLGLAVYVAGLCYSARYLTDGFIPYASSERFAGSSPELRQKLVELSLWDETNGGYLVHDYLDYNPPAAKVKAEREAAKARMGQKRGKKQQFAGSSQEIRANNNGNSSEVHAPRTRTPLSSSKEEDRAPSPKPPNETYETATILAEICAMDFEVNKGRLLKEAKLLLKATPKATPAVLRENYGAGGWWWSFDWRGKEKEWPQPATIRETWGKWKTSIPDGASEVW